MSRFRSSGLIIGLLSAAIASSCADHRTTSPTTPRAASAPLSLRPAMASAQLPLVRISEFHYDNASTDVDEKIEISGPAGMSLVGWQIVRYNGNAASRAPYTTPAVTTPLPAAFPSTTGPGCSAGRAVVVIAYAANGLQNGGSGATDTSDPDGFALVDNTGAVVEFLSYEGSFTAASGGAAGMTSVDVGVRELGTEPINPVTSVKRTGANTWTGPGNATDGFSLNNFGACNDNEDTQPPPPVVDSVAVAPAAATVTVGATQHFTATAFDASKAPVPGTTFIWSLEDNNAAEIVASIDANGLVTTFKSGDVTVTATAPNSKAGIASLHINGAAPPPPLPPTRFSEIHYDNTGTDQGEAIEVEGPGGTDLTGWSIVLYDGTTSTSYNTTPLSGTVAARVACDGRGVVVVNYPTNGIQNGSNDGFALVNAAGEVVEFFSYEGTLTPTDGPAAGRLSVDIGVAEPSTSPVTQSLQRNSDGVWLAPATSTFGRCTAEGPPPAENGISFVGRLPSDPALPVGFEDQLFATERDGTTNAVINTTFTWTSETPGIASIDANGVMHALSTGAATFRATAADGTNATFTLPMADPPTSSSAVWAGNTEFGDPIGPPPGDVIIRRDQFTSSFSKTRNVPNWVSAKLEASHFGAGVDRCDCFTYDPLLPADYPRYTTGDYTGAGAFAGYGIDRGHLLRSFDVTASDGDNKFSYLFTNIIPQSHDMNTGAWATLEDSLGKLARNGYDVYMIAGASGTKGTVKNEEKITIPAQVWKVAVIMPTGRGIADVRSVSDLEVIGVIMPNDPGTNSDWKTYKATVDAIEALSGYDLLSLLEDQIEFQVESGSRPPIASVNGPYATNEGGSISVSGVGSSDPDGDPITYSWTFGDGGGATGLSATHTYAQDGSYSVSLTVTDNHGIINTATSVANVGNVAPSISVFPGATLLPGETYRGAGSFADPGADTWNATVDYGDGSGAGALTLSGKTFALSHIYQSAGSFTLTVQISDDDETSARTQTISVLAPTQGIQNLIRLLDESANSLGAKLLAASKQLQNSNVTPAINQLQAFLNELDAMVRSGRLSSARAEPLRLMVERVIRSLTR